MERQTDVRSGARERVTDLKAVTSLLSSEFPTMTAHLQRCNWETGQAVVIEIDHKIVMFILTSVIS